MVRGRRGYRGLLKVKRLHGGPSLHDRSAPGRYSGERNDDRHHALPSGKNQRLAVLDWTTVPIEVACTVDAEQIKPI